MKKRIKKYSGIYSYTSISRIHRGKPDVSFYARITLPGRPEWIKIGWRSEGVDAAYAHKCRQNILTDIREGKEPRIHPQKSLTLEDAYTLWMKNHAEVNTEHPETARYYWKSMIKPFLANKSLGAIRPLDLENLKGKLQKLGLAPQSIKHALALIRRIYRKMIAWDKYSGSVPTAKIEMPKIANGRKRWLTVNEANLVLDEMCMRSEQIHHMALFSLHTGMRWGEVAALSGENIDRASMTINLFDTKSGTDRAVFITQTMNRVIDKLHLKPGVPLFPARSGGFMQYPNNTFRRGIKDLGLNDGINDRRNKVVFHTLRHTFGSWLAMSGIPLYWIGKMMGHSRQETTQRYSHLCPDLQRQAANCVNEMFWFRPVSLDHLSIPGSQVKKPTVPAENNRPDDQI